MFCPGVAVRALRIRPDMNPTPLSRWIFGCACVIAHASAQSLVTDLDPSIAPSAMPPSSSPGSFTASGPRLYFFAEGQGEGGLWASDGSAGGTRLVHRIGRPATGLGSATGEIIDLDGAGRVLFVGARRATGAELWISDGSAGGTTLLADIHPGAESSQPSNLFRVGSRVFFTANAPNLGRELWVTDGTAAGTRLVVDLAPGTASSSGSPSAQGAELNGLALFVARDPSGFGLFATDGTAPGTIRLRQLPTAAGFGALPQARFVSSADPSRVWLWDGIGIFDALLSTDGTVAGTVTVANSTTVPNLRIGSAADLAGDLVFASGNALLKASVNPIQVTTLRSTAVAFNPSALVGLPSQVVFSARDFQSGRELWSTDGTVAGTARLIGAHPPLPTDAFDWFTVSNSGIAFLMAMRPSGSELWISTGTSVGTLQVASFAARFPVRPQFAVWNGEVVFTARDASAGAEPWLSDGTPARTRRLADLATVGTESARPEQIVALRDRIYFTAETGAAGREIWTSDGSGIGTFRLRDLVPGPMSSEPQRLTAWNDGLYFAALGAPPAGQPTIWKSDGVPASGGAVAPLRSLLAGTLLSDFVEFEDALWFVAVPFGSSANVLMRTNGHSFGTQPALGTATIGRDVTDLAVVDGQLFFTRVDGTELWTSDGSAAGSTLVRSAFPNAGRVQPGSMQALGERLLFILRTANGSFAELWGSDGSSAGTVSLGGSLPVLFPEGPIEVAGEAWLRGTNATGPQIWRTDGTIGGTQRVTGFVDSHRVNARVVGRVDGRPVIVATDPTIGRELFTIDPGTGTVTPLADLAVGTEGSDPEDVVVIGNRLLFSADIREARGRELHVSDGTTAGTRRVLSDSGAIVRDPSGFARNGTSVFFQASSFPAGAELWSLDTDSFDTALVDRYGTACAGPGQTAPRLASLTAPALGAGPVVELRDARPTSPAAVLVGLRRAEVDIGSSCALLVDQVLAHLPVTTDAVGRAAIPLTMTTDPALLQLELDLQPVGLDPNGAWFGIANFGDAIALRIGR